MCVSSVLNVKCRFAVDNVRVSSDGSVMTISNVEPVNQGAYRCVASNLYGVTHSIASLIVGGMVRL